MVKVSIIIPVFNVSEYLEECLNSIVNQSLEDIEIICVDDCSTDNSLDILNQYANKDSRIKIIKNSKNKGQGFSRNIGIKYATGEYIGFVDSDDYVDSKLFELTFNKAKELDLDLLLFKSFSFDNETGELTDINKDYLSLKCLDGVDKLIFTHEDTKEVTCNISVSPWEKIYKRDFLVENLILFPENIIFEDEVFFYRVYLNANRVSLMDDYLYYYRINRENSTMVRKDNKFMDVVDAFKLIRLEFIQTNNYDNEYKKFLFNKFMYSIFTRFNETDDKFKKEFFFKIKKDFHDCFKTQNDLKLLYESYRKKVINVLFSKSYDEFYKYENNFIPQKHLIKDLSLVYKISIIIPVYNMEDYLYNAIESIKNQTFGFENIEVILVDDNSTDNSRNIIRKYCKQYENIKGVFLKENSGFAGKPRNIGIKYASAEYIMFLDPDDTYLEDACEILYNNIVLEDVDIVSGNFIDSLFQNNETYDWENKFGLKGNKIKVNSINENINLLNVYPSVWAKIFKKEFILDNKIQFPENLPGQDLYFVHHCLFKARGILFINKAIVSYVARDMDDEEKGSVSCNNSKKVLIGFIELYYKHLTLFDRYSPNNKDIVLKSLYYWITKFIDSNLELSEIKEITTYSSGIFQKFLELNLPVSQDKYSLFDAISKNDLDKVVVELSKLNKNSNLIDVILKNKQIFLVCYALEPQIGGLAKSVLNRSKKLSRLGYNITILTVDFGQNYSFIIEKLRNECYLDENVNIINLFDYYKNKNSLNSSDKIAINEKNNHYDYEVVYNEDNSFDKIYFKNDVKIKSERYFNNYLAIERFYEDDLCIKERAFTNDGFCYYEMFIKNNREFYSLNNRKDDLSVQISAAHEYNKQLHLQTYFFEEICRGYEDKPFLIIESTGHIPSIGNVPSSLAYKIGHLHGNIFKEPYILGSEIQSFSAINDREKLERIVTLTESQKEDLIKEFGYERFVSIPNFVEYHDLNNVKKDLNKISFVSSISILKNLFDLVKAFKIVIESKKDAKLEIFGRAYLPNEIEELNKIKRFIVENNMQNNVIFRGYTDKIYEEMENSLATVFTSHSEGFCLAIIESMLNATPAIAFNFNYGPKDIITNNVNGIIVDKYNVDELAKSIINLLNNPVRSIKMGQNARAEVLNKFLDNTVISRWGELFKDVLDNHEIKSSINLSIVIPVYNSEKYLNKCLNSIVNQTLNEIEIICIDDCSTDNSLEILYDFAAKDERIKIISLNENHGQGFARNRGIDLANGEYLSFIDSDDWLELNTYEITYNQAKTDNLDLILFGLINFNNNTNEYFETSYYNMNFLNNEKNIFNYKSIMNKLFSIPVGPVNKIYRTNLIKENNIYFPENYSMFEDNPFFHDFFLSSERCSFISKKFYYRRIHDESTMMKDNRKLFEIIPILNDVISIFIKHNLFEEFNHILFNHKYSVIKMWYERAGMDIKPIFYEYIKEDFEKNKFIHNILVENKLTEENHLFLKSILKSDTFKEFDLMLQFENLKRNIGKPQNEIPSVEDYKQDFNLFDKKEILHLISLNRRYKDKIKYLEYLNKELKKEINTLNDNKKFYNKLKNILN